MERVEKAIDVGAPVRIVYNHEPDGALETAAKELAMAGASTLDPDNLPEDSKKRPKGHDTRSLGPSDSSDSGSDMPNATTTRGEGMDADSDRHRTGERAGPGKHPPRPGADRDTDRVVGPDEAGLGGGLDQAEEARGRKRKQ